ncbi:hypothetical protein AYL99_08002 [Fonsecaea erecta]|uniref:Putative transcription factor kapC n=1 Tax=Fonsecaea erecta TaxID=1367422 RepID=A0A178ZBV9_9EURO|nr:hypothetical protein AYL99_08002 [Fonsecaea erecta]OAP57264.1 hypothetical protein AYL99_08002 [Fonsecaea erecta]
MSAQMQPQSRSGLVAAEGGVNSSEPWSGCAHYSSVLAVGMSWGDDENGLQVVPASQSRNQAVYSPNLYPQAWAGSNWEGTPIDAGIPPSTPLQHSLRITVDGSGSRSVAPGAQTPGDKSVEELQARTKLVSPKANTTSTGPPKVDHEQLVLQERRRAQNRVSQQAFRARKQSHIKGLEQRLEAFQAEHETMLKDFTRREAEIHQLQTRIAELCLEIDMLLCARTCSDDAAPFDL